MLSQLEAAGAAMSTSLEGRISELDASMRESGKTTILLGGRVSGETASFVGRVDKLQAALTTAPTGYRGMRPQRRYQGGFCFETLSGNAWAANAERQRTGSTSGPSPTMGGSTLQAVWGATMP